MPEMKRVSQEETNLHNPTEETEMLPNRYARMREDYLRENQDSLYQILLISGELDDHLTETGETAQRRMDELTEAFLTKEPAPPRSEMVAWTAHMNSVRARAEEIVLSEIVYRQR